MSGPGLGLAFVIAGLFLAILDWGDFVFDWWILALLLIVLGAWLAGWFRPGAWIADATLSAQLDRADQDIDRRQRGEAERKR